MWELGETRGPLPWSARQSKSASGMETQVLAKVCSKWCEEEDDERLRMG